MKFKMMFLLLQWPLSRLKEFGVFVMLCIYWMD